MLNLWGFQWNFRGIFRISADPPIIVALEQIFASLDDTAESVLILHHLRQLAFSFESRVLQHLEELHLFIIQVRMPQIQNQEDSGVVAIMPRLMVVGVIEDQRLSLLLLHNFVTHTNSTRCLKLAIPLGDPDHWQV